MTNLTTEIKAPRAGTKQAKLVAMLMRKSGVTVSAICKALDWQSHTTRAAFSGLRKRGYRIEKFTRDGRESVYKIYPPLLTEGG